MLENETDRHKTTNLWFYEINSEYFHHQKEAEPQSNAYNMTPQTPHYFRSCIQTSTNDFRCCVIRRATRRSKKMSITHKIRKSKISYFILCSSSNSKFSGFKSRCTTIFRCMHSTPLMICWKSLRASSFLESTSWHNEIKQLTSWERKKWRTTAETCTCTDKIHERQNKKRGEMLEQKEIKGENDQKKR